MKSKSFTIVPALSAALFLLSQGVADAGFLYAEGDSWQVLASDFSAGASNGSPTDSDENSPADSVVQFIGLDVALIGQFGVSVPGGMSSNTVDHGGQSFPVGSAVSPVALTGPEFSIWLRLEGQPRLPPPLSTMILDPPRSLVMA
jgi:hypothetical protein